MGDMDSKYGTARTCANLVLSAKIGRDTLDRGCRLFSLTQLIVLNSLGWEFR